MKVVILTCDKNQWVLPVFFHLFKKFWPDCPWPVEVVGGPLTEPNLDGYTVFRGDDACFSDLLLEYLKRYDDSDLVLLFLEDLVLMDTVDTERVLGCYNAIEQNPSVMLMRLNACPGPTLPWIPGVPELEIGLFDKEDPSSLSYLSSLQPCIYRAGYLRRLLRPGEDPWDLEIAGSQRARTLPGHFLGSKVALVPVHNFLIRGQINPDAAKEVQEKW